MATLNQVCVYCGSGTGEDPVYAESARILGRALAEARIRLVYGGGSVGLMGVIARTMLDEGGEVVGIIPRFLEKRERMLPDVTELIVTEDMPELGPGELFDQLFQRADAAGQADEGVGSFKHQHFALMHVFGDDQFADIGKHALLFFQESRDDAGDLAARIEHGAGDDPHQSDRAAAVDEPDAGRRQSAARPQEAIELPAGVSSNIIDASFEALLDAITYKLLKGSTGEPMTAAAE